jgi:hypothetical protein
MQVMTMTNNTAKRQTRSRQTGRYSFDGQLERACRCGLTLGQHTAEAPHIVDDMIDGVQRYCPRFRPARAPVALEQPVATEAR